ncbi:MAG: 50S ribosomal protein L24 [Pseudomonadota bacterium]
MASKFRKGDRVVVLAGRDKGKQGEIIRVIPGENRAIVRGVNIVRRHTRQTAQTQGGIISREAPIQLSNLAHEDPGDGKPTRVGFRFEGEGEDRKKVRFAKRSGELIPERT